MNLLLTPDILTKLCDISSKAIFTILLKRTLSIMMPEEQQEAILFMIDDIRAEARNKTMTVETTNILLNVLSDLSRKDKNTC